MNISGSKETEYIVCMCFGGRPHFLCELKKTNAAFDYDGHLTIGQVYSRHYTTLLWQGTPVCTCDLVFLFSFLFVFCSVVVKYML